MDGWTEYQKCLLIFVLGNVYWTFFLRAVIRLFETPKMFYLRMDGMGWMDGRNIKIVLQFSLYFVGI